MRTTHSGVAKNWGLKTKGGFARVEREGGLISSFLVLSSWGSRCIVRVRVRVFRVWCLASRERQRPEHVARSRDRPQPNEGGAAANSEMNVERALKIGGEL
jgi:hypothetical protein